MAVQRWERLEASSGDHQTRSWWNRRSAKVCTEIGCNCLSFPWHHQQWYPWFFPVRSPLLRKKSKLTSAKHLRANVSMRQTNSGKSPKFVFTPTFIFCSPICSNNCGVVFLWKYILVFEKLFFSFDRSNMQIFTVDITRVVWPHVTNVLDLQYFCEHDPLFYHLNLNPCRYWS